MNDLYKTIEKESRGYFKDKGSKFFAYAYPLHSEDEVKEIISNLKNEHHKARHHCYAWRLGTEKIRFRANDDGEPSSTAGKPILGQLQSYEVTNILLVVVRYFGGTLLGVSGLINAYKNASIDALENAEIEEKLIEKKYRLSFTYNELNNVMRKIKEENYTVLGTDFQEDCKLDFSVRKSEAEKAESILKTMYPVKFRELTE